MFRKNCLICDSNDLKEIINLGMHPFADTFVPQKEAEGPDVVYPLICDLCKNCGQVQIRCITNPKERYCKIDYSYTSSNSEFSRTHWENYAKEVSLKANLGKDGFIVEIGSNDGYLSYQFLKEGQKVLGVDPSPYMNELAKKNGVSTLTSIFNEEVAKDIIKNYGKADMIIANNVFNHSNNPLDFAKGVRLLLKDDGIFVFELPYWQDTIKSGKFDQIYQEHISYFTALSSKELMERVGMTLFDIDIINYHGGSLRVYVKPKEALKDHCKKALDLIEMEKRDGLFKEKTYYSFVDKINRERSIILKKIYEIKGNGISIVAVGAAAKGNTLLNFYGLNNTTIDYVTDASPHKQNKFTPLSRIPIRGDEVFSHYKEVYALILSWNISNQLKDILYKINPNIKFIELDK